MRFSVGQAIAAPRSAVEAAFLDEGFYQALGGLSGIGVPQVLERRPDARDGNLVHLEVRYAFSGNLSGPARAVLDPDRLTWVDRSTFDRTAHRIDFEMIPDHYGDRFECRGSYRFEVVDDRTTRQVMEGDLRVRYPVVGAVVERALIVGLREHIDEEARLLERWLRERGEQVASPH